MEIHLYCSIFPPMSDEEFDGLVESIKKSGLLEAIVTFEGKILDGRNRYAACEKAGVRPHFIACPEADPLDYVEAKNLNRRHLSASQRAFAAAKLTGMKRGTNRFSVVDGGHPPSTTITSAEAARRGHVNRATITEARAVSEKGVPELHKEVEKGAVTVHAASKFATLPPEEQKEIAAQGPEAIIAKAKEIKKAAAAPDAEYTPPEAPLKRMTYRPTQGMHILQQTFATFDRVSHDDAEYVQALRSLVAYAEEKLAKALKK